MNKAIVTGANGFVGSNLVKELVSHGVKVYAIVRNNERAENIESLQNVSIIECEMSNYSELYKLISDKQIDIFYHLAWDGTVGDKRSDYILQLNNAKCTCDAIKVSKRIGVKKFIFTGSLIEYEFEKCSQENYFDIGINNIYGIGKITARNMAQILAHNMNIDLICTTISNIYGVGESSQRLINTTLKKLISGQKMSFTSCEQLYDFIYIDDAVKALYLIGEKGLAFKNYYIGNKTPRPLREFIMEIKDLVDKDVELGIGELSFKGISLTYKEFDTHSLYDDFNFQPMVSFKEGIQRTIEWLDKRERE